MPLGKKVADIYAELNLDKDELRRAMAAAGGEMGADADRLGRQLGDRMSQGMADRVEALSSKVGAARLQEKKATDAVTLAEAKLNEARQAGNTKASTLLGLEQRLAQAQDRLTLAHQKTTAAVVKHSAAEQDLARAMENGLKDIGPSAQRAGSDGGDKLAMGMRLAIIRNSPLIAAGVGAALAAGAPVAIAGATALFAGIGIVAAAQSEDVQRAWTGTWDEIVKDTEADAAVMVPVLVGAAKQIGDGFQKLRPQLRDVFAASAPEVNGFVAAVMQAADNAMPGFVRAVENSGPVMQGLDSLVESVGTGLGNFFSIISGHSGAAGTALASLGSIVSSTLSILGTLSGEGTELASAVLPPLAAVLNVVASALDHLGPALPIVAAGFGAFKIANQVTGWLGGMVTKMESSAVASGRFGGAITTMGGAASKALQFLPAVGTAIALVAEASAAGDSKIRSWSDALLQGGNAADKAAAQMEHVDQVTKAGLGGLHSWGDVWDRIKALTEGTTDATAKATAQMHAELAAMDPITRAQTLQKQALNDLNAALEKHGAGSASAEVAERRYKDASDAVTDAQSREELAIHGVTQAMIDQADQAIAAIDSNFALQHATEQQRQAQEDLAQAIKDHGANSQQAQDAENNYAEAIFRTAQAAGQLAADQSGLDKKSLEYKETLDSGVLKSLLAVEGQLSGPTKAAVDGFITQLEQAGVSADGVGASADTTGQKLDDLGQKNPKPTIGPADDKVTPQVDNLMNSLFDLGTAHPVPKADLDDSGVVDHYDPLIGMLNSIGAQRPTPQADLDLGRFNKSTLDALGQVGNLQAQHPTPTADLNPGPFQNIWNYVMSSIGMLGVQHPTPTAFMADAPFQGAANSMSSMLNYLGARAIYPSATLIANTLAAERALDYAARNRTSYVAQVYYTAPVGAGNRPAAMGGRIGDVVGGATGKRFDFGGKISGPGGPTDDLIQAITNMGAPLRVSNDEWVIRGSSSAKYGDYKMAAVNDGRAVITVPGPRPAARFATGGNPGGAGTAAGGITINQLTIEIAGTYDLASSSDLRRAAKAIRDEIVKIERSAR